MMPAILCMPEIEWYYCGKMVVFHRRLKKFQKRESCNMHIRIFGLDLKTTFITYIFFPFWSPCMCLEFCFAWSNSNISKTIKKTRQCPTAFKKYSSLEIWELRCSTSYVLQLCLYSWGLLGDFDTVLHSATLIASSFI